MISLGEIERELGDNSIKFEQEIKRTWIKKLEQYINVDINNANHIKRVKYIIYYLVLIRFIILIYINIIFH